VKTQRTVIGQSSTVLDAAAAASAVAENTALVASVCTVAPDHTAERVRAVSLVVQQPKWVASSRVTAGVLLV